MPNPRGPLPPDVERAARTVSRAAWGQSYKPGEGCLHWGGGPAHAAGLRAKADEWERLARAARVCADWLGDGAFPDESCVICGDRGWIMLEGSLYDGSVGQLPCPDCQHEEADRG